MRAIGHILRGAPALVALLLGPIPDRAFAQAASVAALQQAVTDAIDEAEKSVVAITQVEAGALNRQVLSRNGAGGPRILIQGRPLIANPLGLQRLDGEAPPASGAGVVIDKAGIILTQYLVVDPDMAHVVTDIEGRRYSATLIALDPRSGLAVLQIDKDNRAPGKADWAESAATAAAIGEAERLRKGRFVVAIGNPYSLEADGQPTVSFGIVSNTARKAPDREPLNETTTADGGYRTTLHHFGSLIQTDARLGWNAGGGALVTLDGKLVGVTTSASVIAGHESPAGYAIPMNEVMRRVIGELREGREPEYALLGISFSRNAAVSQRSGRTGIPVLAAYRGGPAGRAGLLKDDLVLSIEGQPVRTADELQLAVGSLPAGAEASVEVERQGVTKDYAVRLGKAYVDGRRVATSLPPSWRGLRVDFPTAVPAAVLQQKSQAGEIDPLGCVVVSSVEPGSISAGQGVTPYSYISHVGDRRVTTPDEFYAAVRDAGSNVRLKFTKPLLVRSAKPDNANGPANDNGPAAGNPGLKKPGE